jgi:hypothetical protein
VFSFLKAYAGEHCAVIQIQNGHMHAGWLATNGETEEHNLKRRQDELEY